MPPKLFTLDEANGLLPAIGPLMRRLKDLDQGLVDFLAQRGGEQVFLCWRLGEPAIRYWHRLQDGFANRKPLQEDPVE